MIRQLPAALLETLRLCADSPTSATSSPKTMALPAGWHAGWRAGWRGLARGLALRERLRGQGIASRLGTTAAKEAVFVMLCGSVRQKSSH